MVRKLEKIYFSGFLVLFFSLFYYQIIKGNYYSNRALNNYLRTIPSPPIRGSIFDRNGYLLATDQTSFNIAVIPFEIRNKKNKLFKEIAQFLNYDAELIFRNYQKRKSNLFSPVDIILNIKKEEALRLKAYLQDAILINPYPQRYYLYPYEFAHILGYVKQVKPFYKNLKKYGYTPYQRVGFLGVEQYYDPYLRGEEGGDLVEVNAKGEVVGFLGRKIAQKGKDIYLTIDYRMQRIAYEALKGRRGTVILMDSKKGEILVLVSYPSFNPNYFIQGNKKVKGVLRSKFSPLVNRAIQLRYALGSTFKPIVAVAGLEEKIIVPSTTFFCQGQIKLGEREFRCRDVHQQEDMFDALTHSCNIYFYHLGLKLGVEKLIKWAKKFGLDSFAEIDLPYEKRGFVPYPGWKKKKLKQRWYKGDTLNLSIGQGFMEITPLEILLAINVFANEGYLVRPYLLKKVEDLESEISLKNFMGISKENLKAVKKGLIYAVEKEDGTAHILKRLNLKIAGKTGTAQSRGRPHGWFVGFFPYDNPRYTFCVFLENAGSSYEALKVSYYFLKKLKEEELI